MASYSYGHHAAYSGTPRHEDVHARPISDRPGIYGWCPGQRDIDRNRLSEAARIAESRHEFIDAAYIKLRIADISLRDLHSGCNVERLRRDAAWLRQGAGDLAWHAGVLQGKWDEAIQVLEFIANAIEESSGSRQDLLNVRSTITWWRLRRNEDGAHTTP